MKRFWKSVHALRGIAALLVVIHHVPQYLVNRMADVPMFERGAAGVDIFFAISGFVMYATASKANRNWQGFLISRASRILPLYWLCTLILGGSALLLPSLFKTFNTNVETVIRSMLFLPIYNGEGQIRPLLQMGWTLHYEVLFYIVTGMCLLLSSRNAAWLGASVLTAIAAALSASGVRLNHTPLILLAPIVTEFLFGVLVAHLATQHQLGNRPASALHQLIAMLALPVAISLISASLSAGVGWDRVLFWGGAGFLFLYSGVILEPVFDRLLFKLLGGRFLGDVSYALYLTHGFALSIGFKLAKFLGLGNFGGTTAVMVITSLIFAAITHYLIEKKLNDLFYRGLSSIISRPS